MADITITVKLSVQEFDLMRKSIESRVTTLQDLLRHPETETKERAATRALLAQYMDLVAKFK